MRIALAGMMHESCTFSRLLADLDDFQLVRGSDIFEYLNIGDVVRQLDVECVPVLHADLYRLGSAREVDELGLFDDPLRGIDSKTVIGSPESRQVSLEAARESITLLKNENHMLPLAKTAHVLVTGPDADSLIPLNNGWSYTWQGDRASASDHARERSA